MGPSNSSRLPSEAYWSRCASVWSRNAIFKHPPSPFHQIEKKGEKSFRRFPTTLIQHQRGRAAFMQSDVHLSLERVYKYMHAAVLPLFIKSGLFLISLIIFISFTASFVMQFHLMYVISLPWVRITSFKFPSYIRTFSQARRFCQLVTGTKNDLCCISSFHQHKPTLI
jgi:hypothetical protein